MKIKLLRTTAEIQSCQPRTAFNEPCDSRHAESEALDELLVSDERRSFLGLMTGLIGAGISSVLGITLGRFSIIPALLAPSASEWVDVALLEEIPEGKTTNRSVSVSQSAGWGHFRSDQSVLVGRKGPDLTVFSTVCPHLGCTINENANGFGCVCHNSAWNGEGKKLGGPAPRDMDILEHKVESNVLRVRYQNFKQGVSDKQVAS